VGLFGRDKYRDGYSEYEVDADDEAAKKCDGTSRHTQSKEQAFDSGRRGGNREIGWRYSRRGDADQDD
jgi:hypothetical protein